MDKFNIIFFSTSGMPKVKVSSNRILGLTKELSRMNNNVYLFTCRYKEFPYNLENDFSHCEKVIIVKPLILLTFFLDLLRKLYKKISNLAYSPRSKSSNVTCKCEKKKIIWFSRLREKFTILDYYIPEVGFITPNIVTKTIKSNINLGNLTRTILFTTNPSPICHELGIILKQKYKSNIFWVADYRDPIEQNLYLDRETSKKMKLINVLTLQKADLITTVSKGIKDLLIEQANNYGFNIKRKAIIISNGFDNVKLSNFSKKDISNYSKIRIVYTGRLYRGIQSPGPLFKAISFLAQDIRKRIEIVYAGPDERIFLQYANKFNVLDVAKSLGFITKEQVLDLQKSASILLVIKSDRVEEEGVLTGKFFEYLMFKKPIITIGDRDNEFNKLSQKIGGIKIFGYNQSKKLYILLEKCIRNDGDMSLLFGQINEREIIRFTWQNLTRKLIKKINSMV